MEYQKRTVGVIAHITEGCSSQHLRAWFSRRWMRSLNFTDSKKRRLSLVFAEKKAQKRLTLFCSSHFNINFAPFKANFCLCRLKRLIMYVWTNLTSGKENAHFKFFSQQSSFRLFISCYATSYSPAILQHVLYT